MSSSSFSLALAACLALAAGGVAVADDSKPADKPAGEAPKKEEAPPAPAFKLKDLDGKERTLEEFKGKWVVLEWTNMDCPFVKKFYDPGFMQKLQKTYTDQGVVWLSVCSSAPKMQGNMTADQWKKTVADKKIASTAVLLDADGTAGKAYAAKTTPDMRIISPKGTLVFQGGIDDNKDMKADPTKANNYVVQVLDAVLAGKDAPVASAPSYGCSVKYPKP